MMKHGTKNWLLAICLMLAVSLSAGVMPTHAEETMVLPGNENTKSDAFFTDEINALIDENYELVKEQGWAELRIPQSVHGITEDYISPNALDAAKKLIDAGYEACIIGGAMRDIVMGTATSDFDIVSNATLEEQEKILGDVTYHEAQGGYVFGFAHYPDEIIDIAQCLNIPACYYGLPGVPEFDPSSLYSDSFIFDSFERDLTFNAIYYDVKTGDLVDYHGGLHDIREGIVETMGDPLVQFENNPVSAIRALRFMSRYGFLLSDRVEEVMQAHGAEYMRLLNEISVEFNLPKYFASGYSRAGYEALMEYGAFPVLYPPASGLCRTEAYIRYAQAATDWMDEWHEAGNVQDDRLAMAVFLWPVVALEEDASSVEEQATAVLEAERAVCSISPENFEQYLALFELESAMTESFTEEEAEEILARSEFENAYELLLIRAKTEDGLGDAVEFWTSQRGKALGEEPEAVETPEETIAETPEADETPEEIIVETPEADETPEETMGETPEAVEPPDDTAQVPIPEGVVPVTWEVSRDHLMIEGEEARALYERIVANDYPSMEELKANPVVAQLDALAAYYKQLYGNTADIDTPEREQLRQDMKDWFLSLGSARTESIDENGRHHYVYDGPLQADYEMELVLGLPASGKSTTIVDPDSEAMGAFIMDCDTIKAELPEYKESHGAGADAVHFEGYYIMLDAIDEFLTGDMVGTNVIIPIVSTNLEELLENYVYPFEKAGYRVKVKFCPAEPHEAAARVIMRELAGGQLINSAIAFGFGPAVEEVYQELAEMINSYGEPYGYDVEEEMLPAA